MNCHPEQVPIGGIGVYKLGVLWHAQIMTSDAAYAWLGGSVFSAIALATRSQAACATSRQRDSANTQALL